MKFTNSHLINEAKNEYNYKLSSLENMSDLELEEIIDKYQDWSIWRIDEEFSLDLSIYMKNSLECYMKAVKGELQERAETKKVPYLNEIDFLKKFIKNNSNSIPFEIIGHNFNGKLYRIMYEVDVNESEVFWRHPSELAGLSFGYFDDPNKYSRYFVTRRISIMCNDGRKMTIVRCTNRVNSESIKINYEVATKEGIAFYPYKFSCEELNYFKEMFFQKIVEAIIEQEQKEKELQEGTKKFVKTLCNQRPKKK